MYDNFVFDLYGTLVDISTDESSELLWKQVTLYYGYHGAWWKPEELRQAYAEKVLSLLAGKADTEFPEIKIEDCFEYLYRSKGVDPKPADVSATCRVFRLLSTEYIKNYPATLPTLQYLKSHKKKIYLLSNAQAAFTRPELCVLGLDRMFDGIWISSEFGASKPAANFLGSLIESEGLDPRTTLMVGNDSSTDLEVALRCGIDSALINTNHTRPECLVLARSKASHVIESGNLAEVLQLKPPRQGFRG